MRRLTLFARLAVVLTCITVVLLVPSGWSQQVASTVIHGPTPPELAPPGPANVLALSGFDNVDLYSGHLTLGLPLHTISGRGDAGYTITLPVSNPPWSIESV